MRFSILSSLLIALAAAPTLADLPAARLNAISPPGGRAGTSVDVTTHGIDLDGATDLRFSHPGITAKAGDGGKFTVTIAKDVPPGVYDCRAIGKYGITNPRAFVVGDREEVDVKPGASAGNAGKLPLDRVVNAQTTANVIDFWTFDATKGQRLMINCDAREIDSRLSPSLVVIDTAGRELARSRRTGFLDFTAPDAASYTLRVSDMLYRGGTEFIYRLSISTAPHIDAIFPPAGKAGTKAKFTLLGRNLPGGNRSDLRASDGNSLETLDVEIELPKEPKPEQRLDAAGVVGPSGATINGFAYRLASPQGVSNPVGIVYVDGDVTAESEAVGGAAKNDSPETAQQLTVPATVAGRFAARRDRDWYSFDAKKGDVYSIEVISDRLNQPTAVSLIVSRADDPQGGKPLLESPDDETNLGSPAFRTATRDAVLKLDVPKDGTYRLCVRDKFGVAVDDPARQYLLIIRKPSPDFAVVATPLSGGPSDTAMWNPLLRKGGSAAIRVHVQRQDGFTGDVRVEAEGLPSGVTCCAASLPGGETTGVVVLTADSDVKRWAGEVKLIARGKIDDSEVTRPVRCGTIVWGTVGDGKNNDANKTLDPVVSRLTRDICIGVSGDEEEPLTIAPAEEKTYEVQQGGKLSIPLKIKKSAELKQPLKLKLANLENGKNGKDVTVDPSAEKATLELDTSQTRLSPGTYTFCLASPALIRITHPGEPASSDSGKEKKAKGKTDPKDTAITVYSAPIKVVVTPKPEKEKKKG